MKLSLNKKGTVRKISISEKIDTGIINLWRAQSAEEKATENLKRMTDRLLRSVNKQLLKLGVREQLPLRGEHGDYINAKDIFIHVVIPNYPSEYSTMGLLLVRVTDPDKANAVFAGNYNARYVINLERLNSAKAIAGVIKSLLENPTVKSRQLHACKTLLTEKEAKLNVGAKF